MNKSEAIKILNDIIVNKDADHYRNYYTCLIGKFAIKIWIPEFHDYVEFYSTNKITDCPYVHIALYEKIRDPDNSKILTEEYIDLESDSRFKNYKPIKYAPYPGYSNGDDMPINYLCKLMMYLSKLNNLMPFW